MINCIVVDDEPLAQEILEKYIRSVPQLSLVRKCNNALEAFDILQSAQIELMFLDIKMPSLNGIDFLKALKNPPQVIFTTAYAEFAITGFELDAVDYLLKPVTFERFEKSIQKLLRIHSTEKPAERTYSYFKVSGKLVKIYHADLMYAQSVKDYILLKTIQGSHLTHMTMKYLSELLPQSVFVRVHRSFLVNKTCIDLLEKAKLRVGDVMVPIGENYRMNLDGLKES
ncbi:MAG: response regulator transcription factor [Pedobacter sp.]|nr:response regulator transcription factor [Pedobacter sp.]